MTDNDAAASAPRQVRDQTSPKMVPKDPNRQGFLIIAYAGHFDTDEQAFSDFIERNGYEVGPLLVEDGSVRKFILSNVPYSKMSDLQGNFFVKWLRNRPEANPKRKPCAGDCSSSGKCVRPGCICINGKCT